MKKVNMKAMMKKAHAQAKVWRKAGNESPYSYLLSFALRQVWAEVKGQASQGKAVAVKAEPVEAVKATKDSETKQAKQRKRKSTKQYDMTNNRQAIFEIAKRHGIHLGDYGTFEGSILGEYSKKDYVGMKRNLLVMLLNRGLKGIVHYSAIQEYVNSGHYDDHQTALYEGFDLLFGKAYANHIYTFIDNNAINQAVIDFDDILQSLIFKALKNPLKYTIVSYYTNITRVMLYDMENIVRKEKRRKNGLYMVHVEEIDAPIYNAQGEKIADDVQVVERYVTPELNDSDKAIMKDISKAKANDDEYDVNFDFSALIQSIRDIAEKEEDKFIIDGILQKKTVRQIRDEYKEKFGKDCRRQYDKYKKRIKEMLVATM